MHQRAILDELQGYERALEFDILFLDAGSGVRLGKEQRLAQIKQYIEATEQILQSDVLESLGAAFPAYPEALQGFMRGETNLYSMVLRPSRQDDYLRFIDPVFRVKRDVDSVLYTTLQQAYDGVTSLANAQSRIEQAVLATEAAKANDFAGIQAALALEVKRQLGKTIDFTRSTRAEELTQAFFERALGSTNLNAEDYIQSLIAAAAPELSTMEAVSPFYNRKDAEELSIITQFFLGSVNIYCRALGLSQADFAAVLDNSLDLSQRIAGIVLSINDGSSIEAALLGFINSQHAQFGLQAPLSAPAQQKILQDFQSHYAQIREAEHFDEFAVLIADKPGPFVEYQGSIGLCYADFILKALPEYQAEQFEALAQDFEPAKQHLSPTNPHLHHAVSLSVEDLAAKIDDEASLERVLKKLPPEDKAALQACLKFKVFKLLNAVARGGQEAADRLLKDNPDADLLLQSGPFTDYSGRTFNCTAFEYAYWAKDTHMCRMLETHMNPLTKAEMLERIEAMEEYGLSYRQQGEVQQSPHFDMQPLIRAYDAYINGYEAWSQAKKGKAIKRAWFAIGKAQRELPVHVINEYCRPDRSFNPCPAFNEASLPRTSSFYNMDTERDELFFPLAASDAVGLGVDFVLVRAGTSIFARGSRMRWTTDNVAVDRAAVTRLNAVRTEALTQLRSMLAERRGRKWRLNDL